MPRISKKSIRSLNASVRKYCKQAISDMVQIIVQSDADATLAAVEARRVRICDTPHNGNAGETPDAPTETRSRYGCGCEGCARAPATATLLSITTVNKLKYTQSRVAELAAHGKVDVGNALAQKTALKAIVATKGFYLTHETIVDALEQTTHGRDSNVDGAASCVEGSPPVPISNVHRRTRLSFIPSPYDALSLPARRRCRYDECASPPSPDQTPVSDQSLSVLLSPLKKDNLRKRKQDGYSRAIDAVLRCHIFLWSTYAPSAEAQNVYVLSHDEFGKLLEGLLLLLTPLLDEWLELALDKAAEKYRDAREERKANKWPLYAGKGHVLSADACFQVKGYQSPHSMVHFVCHLTQLVLSRFHLTKHALPEQLACISHAVCSVSGVLSNSGDMDWYGTKAALAFIYERRPEFLENALVTRDGDVKGYPISTLAPAKLMHESTALVDGACFTHLLKNLFKFADKELPSVTCKCMVKSTKNHRFTSPLPRNMHAWVYNLMRKAEAIYLPEKYIGGYCNEGEFPESVATDAREKSRANAIEYFCAELDIMLEHFQGNHEKCAHGALAPNAQVFCCDAQVIALKRYIGTLEVNARLLFSPVGSTHVQYVESNHSQIAKVRSKGVNMSAAASFLGETVALLQIQELQFASNGIFRSSLAEMCELVKEHLGYDLAVDELKEEKSLNQRLSLKTKRSTKAFQMEVQKARARKRSALTKNKNKQGTSGAYASGGTTAAVDLAVAVGTAKM